MRNFTVSHRSKKNIFTFLTQMRFTVFFF